MGNVRMCIKIKSEYILQCTTINHRIKAFAQVHI